MVSHRNETPKTRPLRAQELPVDESIGELEPVTYFKGAMPTSVTVSHQGRIFVNFPRWGDEVPFTVSEIHDSETVAYANEAINQADPGDLTAGRIILYAAISDYTYSYFGIYYS